MSRTLSPSSNKPYGVARVASIWKLARSSFYAARQREQRLRQPQKRGPKVHTDEDLILSGVEPGWKRQPTWVSLVFKEFLPEIARPFQRSEKDASGHSITDPRPMLKPYYRDP